MLSKKTLAAIAKLTKTDIAAIEAALKDEKEVDLPVDETLTVLTADELTQRDTNNKATGKTEGQRIGEEIGRDLAVKAIKGKLGITDANKDPDAVASIIQSSMAGDKALKDQVALLQADISKKDAALQAMEATVNATKSDTELLTLLPQKRSSALETAEHLNLVKSNLEFTPEGVKYKGEILRDATTKAALDKKAAVEYFYTQRKGLLESEEGGGPAGRGGGNSGEGGKGAGKTLKEVRKAWEAANPGKTFGDMDSQEHLTKVLKENPDLVMEDDGK
jgi:hypothetical protein